MQKGVCPINLEKIIESFLAQYGRQFSMKLSDGGEYNSRCILSARDGQNSGLAQTEIDRMGSRIKGKYVMFCSKDVPVEASSQIDIAGMLYVADGAESYYIGDSPIYKWALLEKRGSING